MYEDYFLILPTRSEINICNAVARRYARMSSTPTLQPGAGALRNIEREGDRLRDKLCCVERHDTFSAEMLLVVAARSQRSSSPLVLSSPVEIVAAYTTLAVTCVTAHCDLLTDVRPVMWFCLEAIAKEFMSGQLK